MLEHHRYLFMPILNHGIPNRADSNHVTQSWKVVILQKISFNIKDKVSFFFCFALLCFALFVFFFQLVYLFGSQKTCLITPVWTSNRMKVPLGRDTNLGEQFLPVYRQPEKSLSRKPSAGMILVLENSSLNPEGARQHNRYCIALPCVS